MTPEKVVVDIDPEAEIEPPAPTVDLEALPPVNPDDSAGKIPHSWLLPAFWYMRRAAAQSGRPLVTSSGLRVTRRRGYHVEAPYRPPSRNRFRAWLDAQLGRIGGARQSAELALSLQELAVMCECGIGIERALELLASGLVDARLREMYRKALAAVMTGAPLSKGMSQSRAMLPTMLLELVRAGELTGNLPDALKRASRMLEHQVAVRRQLRSRLVYPVFALLACFAVVVLVPAFMFEGIFELLRSLHVEIPWATRLLMLLSQVVRSPLFGLAAPGALVGGAWLYRRLCKRSWFRWWRDRTVLRLPLIGETWRYMLVVEMCHTLACLYDAGVAISQAVVFAGRSVDNLVFAHQTKDAARQIMEGVPISQAMSATHLVPSVVIGTLAAGQDIAALGEQLESVADLLQQEVDCRIEMLTAALEPLLLMITGIVVGSIVIATLLPLLKVMESM